MICIAVGSQQVQMSGSTVLLTGATGGLGQAIARDLHARGALLILSGRRREALDALAGNLGARALAADLSVAQDVRRLADQAGDVDILVANAGLPAAARLERLSAEDVDRALDVNLRAPVALAHALLPGMLARRQGHLVFMSSIAAKSAAPGNPVYHSTKFALRGLAAALRVDLHGSGVGVSCVLPGFISDAGMYAESGARLPRGVGTRTPQDVAGAVVEAIEHDRGEVEVVSPLLRAGTALWALAPDFASSVARRMGSEEIARTYERAMRKKR
jgi:NADP-dependent 3-hydroxy acid dehydrogenase YdfG